MHANAPIEADAGWPPGPLYAAVRREVEEQHRRCVEETSVYEPAKGPPPPTRFVLVAEHAGARGGHLRRSVSRAWVRDGAGLRQIDLAEYQRLSAPGPSLESGFVKIAFGVCRDGLHLVFASVAGPLAGSGGRYRIDPVTLEWHAAGGCWIS